MAESLPDLPPWPASSNSHFKSNKLLSVLYCLNFAVNFSGSSKRTLTSFILVTNIKDVRVLFDEPLKFTAKLRQYKTDNNLLLLKCELEDAGHDGKSGRDSAIEEIAFDYSFILKITNKLNT